MTDDTEAAVPSRHLGIGSLVVVGFFWTTGGIYGTEPALGTAPSGYVLIMCLIMPFFYGLPTALVTAELSTHYPETGGQCVFVQEACGPTIGGHNIYWVWVSTIIDAAIYPQYIAQYIAETADLGEYGGLVDKLLPLAIVIIITSINLFGVDWMLRFETVLGVLALLPCIAWIGIGIPSIWQQDPAQGELLLPEEIVRFDGDISYASVVSWCLWLYGGYTNLGVLAGEAKDPRRTYVAAVAILFPIGVLMRVLPTLIAFSLDDPASQQPCELPEQFTCRTENDGCCPNDVFRAGYFTSVAERLGTKVFRSKLGGDIMRYTFFAGSQISFLGLYNAMILNGERTSFFFFESRFGAALARRAQSKSAVQRWLFVMPEVGIRRIYILGNALVACGFVFLNTKILVELEMLVYATSFLLFIYAFVYLRVNRFPGSKVPEAEAFSIPGGTVCAVLMVIPPSVIFAINLGLNCLDRGDMSVLPVPYFKLYSYVGMILLGVSAQLIYQSACKPSSLQDSLLPGDKGSGVV